MHAVHDLSDFATSASKKPHSIPSLCPAITFRQHLLAGSHVLLLGLILALVLLGLMLCDCLLVLRSPAVLLLPAGTVATNQT